MLCNVFKYILEVLIKSAVIILILFIFLWPVEILGDSMQDTFFNGDLILMSRFSSTVSLYDRYDIVICTYPDSDIEMNAVKRLVGLPGDSIQISEGNVYINGEQINEEYLVSTYTSGEVDITLAQNEYFVLGDNRSISLDSREMGPILKEDIKGKVIIRFFPLSSFKFFT